MNVTQYDTITVSTSFDKINFVGLTVYYDGGIRPRSILIYDRERNADKFTRAGASTTVTQSSLVDTPTNAMDKSLSINGGIIQFMPTIDGIINIFVVGE